MKKITRATIKSFIKKHESRLYIKVNSRFDGMVDCVMPTEDHFHRVEKTDFQEIRGAWFVGQSRDGFSPYEDANFKGYEVYNCTGSFLLATPK